LGYAGGGKAPVYMASESHYCLEFVRNITAPLYSSIGWANKTSHLDKPIALNLACSAGNTDCLAEAKLRFDSWRLNGSSLTACHQLGAAADCVHLRAAESDTRRCGTSCGSATWPDDSAAERERLLRALAMSRQCLAGEPPAGLLAGPRDWCAARTSSPSSATLEPTQCSGDSSGTGAACTGTSFSRLAAAILSPRSFGPEDRRLGAMVPGFARQFNDEFHWPRPSAARNANARRLLGGPARPQPEPQSHWRREQCQVKLRAEQQCQVKLRAEQCQVKLRASSARLQLKALRAVLRSRGAVSRQIVSRAAEAAALTGSDEASLAGSNTVWDGVFTSLSPTDNRRGVRLAAVRPAAGARPLPMRGERAAQPAPLQAGDLRLEASDSELEELAAAYPEKIGSAWVSAGWRASLYRARGQEDAAFAQLQPT
uniref:ANK_REP_REGION domain-containing protein n=1 Tax=Macrostomum lignano TaxID=282301 RepID=A0A1I8JRX7_9PLAT